MPALRNTQINTECIPFNVMDMRDEAFYEFIRQFSGKKVAELLAFQECNGVDSFLGCKDITAVLYLESDQLNDLRKHTCITMNDGTVKLLPGIESSITSLTKLLKKKRDEIKNRNERVLSITSATPRLTSLVSHSSSTLPLSHAPVDPLASVNAHAPPPGVPLDKYSTNLDYLTDDVRNHVATSISTWIARNKEELNLADANIQQGVDFRITLNNQQDAVILLCKCGAKNTIGQKEGILVVKSRS